MSLVLRVLLGRRERREEAIGAANALLGSRHVVTEGEEGATEVQWLTGDIWYGMR